MDLRLTDEQQGRAVAPAPVVEAEVAARALARLGNEELAGALAGAMIVTRLR